LYFIPGNKNGERDNSSKNKNNSKIPLNLIWLAFFLLACLVALKLFRAFYRPDSENTVQQPHARTHLPPIASSLLQNPAFGLPQIKPGDEIVRHYAYTLSFSDKDKEPFWVAYTFKRSYLSGELKRTNRFEPDPDVPTGSANLEDYYHSGYDKGHMAPAADMKWDITAMKESFYLSNVCPQDHKCNDGIWAELERAVRYWTKDDSIEYIVTGPVLPASGSPKIGEDQVTVPAYFYKVIFSPFPYPKAIGFIVPNQPGTQSFWHYACPVSQVEKATGIHFFPDIPGNIVTEVKSDCNISEWKSGESFYQ